ncbi:CRISPR-associated helicase Cas3' [Pantoea sp. BAV 3049]|uniref:CRISPR-associated helicase Cas3' n=1 Tax=Pantoea sp. BAV 3049 TaxID=2654188 RepID=UPI00131EB3F3|nr:CRISPR-associated helicase Cas3' [Pantoea sp. BAV 3049]
MNPDVPDFYRYWGKSRNNLTTASAPYHLLAWHCLDVAACGYLMVKENRYGLGDILADLGLTGEDAEQWIGYLFACHDIGKFARGFQQQASHPGSPLVLPVNGIIYSVRHDSLGYWLWGKLFLSWCNEEIDLFSDITPDERDNFGWALDIWMAISAGHHGKPPDKSVDGCSLAFTKEDVISAGQFLSSINILFPVNKLPEKWLEKSWRKMLKKQSWVLAGIITLADWIGSDERYFPFESRPLPLKNYWSVACERARLALSQLPVPSLNTRYAGHQALFPFIRTLTPLQQFATKLDINCSGPQLFVCEDVTGAGKTEAAIILAHRLLSGNKAKGLYVGLPTMATANAMYYRLSKAYRALFTKDSRPSLVLAHGGRHMSAAFSDSVWKPEETSEYRDYASIDANASSECHEWFADSGKKALLAEVGVGTVDQLLMAVMPFRHQSLRLSGMRDKIMLLDEVHAYDSYMVRLLEGLLRFHASLGGSAIILSATLPASLREKLLVAFSDGAGFSHCAPQSDAGYPWLTQLSSMGLKEQQIQTRKEVQRRVAINWINDSDRALEIIYQAVESGQCICWVRNTVDDALMAFQRLSDEGKVSSKNLLLFHSRFVFKDRMEIENKTLDWFGKEASADNRHGKVLIATQVVEQSLDLDLDLMISDLAPIDLLIQRAGRLQRHIRDAYGNCKSHLPDERHPPELHILAPEWHEQPEPGWLGEELKGTGYVYPDHACLWRTQALLQQFGQIRMPEDARALIDGVYEEKIPTPSGLQTISDDFFAEVLSRRSVATQNLLQRDKGYDRESSDFFWDEGREFSTRLGEMSVDVYLAWLDREGQLQPVANEGDYLWEKSRVQVRLSWWQKHTRSFCLPDELLLEAFRKQIYRPAAQIVLVSENGEASYYNRHQGFTG